MCGLAGMLSSSPKDYISGQVAKMTSFLHHRGPNDEGLWSDDNVCLGQRRLSIIDLSEAGAQPMQSECGRYVLVYNGEIYNHFNIRKKLEIEGVAPNWRGHSDTETVLAAIKAWGIDNTLNVSNGMFALALWDKKTKCLILARDRIGEKPLYWGWAGKDFIFGSELKSLRVHSEFPRTICSKALMQYLRFVYVPAPRSIHPGIYKLEPGTILSIKGRPPTKYPLDPLRPGDHYENLSIRKFWDLNKEIEYGLQDPIKDETEAVNSTEQVLSKAVKGQMISDVPLGAFLSGGIDSSSIVALMQAQSSKPVKTFTIGFDEMDFNEASHASAVAQHIGTEHNEIFLTDDDARAVIPKLPWLYDEPFADSSQIPTHLVCRAAREQVTVALSGDGGDEMFGGYNRHIHGHKLWQTMSFTPSIMRSFIGQVIKTVPNNTWDKVGEFYNFIKSGRTGISNLSLKMQMLGDRFSFIKSFDDLYLNMISIWTEPEKLLKTNVQEPSSILNDEICKFGSEDPTIKMIIQDIRTYLPDDILCKVDRASMGVSLETRAPFLDKDVIRLASRLPINMKIRNGYGKWALRKVLYRYVPQEIFNRPKKGFAIPLGKWLRGPLRDWADDLLSVERLISDDLFNTDVIRKIWNEHLSLKKDRSTMLWAILMFQAWNSSIK